ncbi:MAG: RidA family protein [Chloroflexota bacterium]
MSKEPNPPASSVPKPMGKYPTYRRVGNLLFMSGQGARDPETNKVPGLEIDAGGNVVSYDIEAQCHSVFRNVRNVLEEAGSRWENIVDVVVYLTDLERDFTTYNRVYAEYFPENPPCRTTIGVDNLPSQTRIELKVIATIDE